MTLSCAGKTAAFMLPVLERLLFRPKQDVMTRVLVIVPTRELAVQVYQVSLQLAQFTNIMITLSAGGFRLQLSQPILYRCHISNASDISSQFSWCNAVQPC